MCIGGVAGHQPIGGVAVEPIVVLSLCVSLAVESLYFI